MMSGASAMGEGSTIYTSYIIHNSNITLVSSCNTQLATVVVVLMTKHKFSKVCSSETILRLSCLVYTTVQ